MKSMIWPNMLSKAMLKSNKLMSIMKILRYATAYAWLRTFFVNWIKFEGKLLIPKLTVINVKRSRKTGSITFNAISNQCHVMQQRIYSTVTTKRLIAYHWSIKGLHICISNYIETLRYEFCLCEKLVQHSYEKEQIIHNVNASGAVYTKQNNTTNINIQIQRHSFVNCSNLSWQLIIRRNSHHLDCQKCSEIITKRVMFWINHINRHN